MDRPKKFLDPPKKEKKKKEKNHATFLKKNNNNNCIGPTIRIGRESWCLPDAGFLIGQWKQLIVL